MLEQYTDIKIGIAKKKIAVDKQKLVCFPSFHLRVKYDEHVGQICSMCLLPEVIKLLQIYERERETGSELPNE